MVGGPCANTTLVKPYDDSVRATNIATIIAILVFVIGTLELSAISQF
jgi:hypothetical protein